MKLTQQHIQDLYKFTRQHYVEFYDVQTELVDHLANDIETLWQEKPYLSFNDARDLSFKKFGVFGFSTIVSKRQQAMNKKYMKILWSFAKEWFQLPKIILTLGSVYILFILFSSVYGEYIYYALLFFFFSFLIIKYRYLCKISKARKQISGKKWMLEEMIFTTTSANIFVILSNVFNGIQSAKHLDNFYTAFIFSVLFVAAFLIGHITLVVIPEKGEELLEETYPEYKLANNL